MRDLAGFQDLSIGVMRTIMTCVVIMQFLTPVKGQNNIDSLLVVLETARDSARVNILIELGYEYLKIQPVQSKKYLDEALSLAGKLVYPSGVARSQTYLGRFFERNGEPDLALKAYQKARDIFRVIKNQPFEANLEDRIGQIYYHQSDYVNAIKQYSKSLEIRKLIGDSIGMADNYLNLGAVYDNQGNYLKALDAYFKCLAIDEAVDFKKGIADDYNGIAILYKKQGNFELALEYHHKSIALSELADYPLGIASAYINMGIIYKDQKMYQLALETYQKAIVILEDGQYEYGLINGFHNIGIVYANLGNHQKSLDYFSRSQVMAEKLGVKKAIAANLVAMSDAYRELKEFKQAIATAEEGLKVSLDIGSKEEIRIGYFSLSQTHNTLRNYKKAYNYYKQFAAIKDSISNEEKNKQISQLRISHETDQKEQEIQLLNQTREMQKSEITQQKLLKNISIGILFLLTILAFVIFRNYRLNQQRKRLQLGAELQKEQMEAERLQELDQAKSRFFANIAHEFRTPLTLILGPSEQIIQDPLTSRTKENAGLIKRNADRLLQLINQLLDLSKLESGIIKLYPERKDFVAYVEGNVKGFESLAEEKDIKINFSSKIKKLNIDIDPDKTGIILNNLMSNALKFTPSFGEILVTVEKKLGDNSLPMASVIVQDSGIGVSNEQLPFIFDRFYQVDDSQTRKTQGTGIGLALTKELVELHKGTITAVSAQDEGTRFEILLPLIQAGVAISDVKSESKLRTKIPDPEDPRLADFPGAGSDDNLSESSKLYDKEEITEQVILVVEDNPEVRKFIVDSIGSLYQTLEAENGRLGMEIASEQIPDLIISDVMMPEMDGLEFCKIAKQDERTSHIPVILLTAKAGMDSKIEGLETGADDYLAKPFNAKELQARIKNLINIRKQLQLKYGQTGDTDLLPKRENAFIARLKSVVEDNLDKEQFSMDDLGRAIGMSRTQIHRKLKAITNQSTSQFIRRFRLEKALELLKNHDYNVSEVAYMVGFNSQTYFSTCFSELYGYSPSELTNSAS